MTRTYRHPTKREQKWLKAVLSAPEFPVVSEHRCGVCVGPYGKSSIPCRNDPATRTKGNTA